MSDKLVRCENVSVTLGGRVIMRELNLSINRDDFVMVVGSNGTGKSTLLKLLRQQLMPSSGQVIMDSSLRGHITYCSQSSMDQLCGTMTVKEHVRLYYPQLDFDGVKQHLADCHPTLGEHVTTPVGEFSGGEKQAFVLGLMMLAKPTLLLFDEHTSALDPKTASTIMALTERFVREFQVTCVMTTHHVEDALRYGSRLVAIKNGRVHCDYEGVHKLQLAREDVLAACY